MNTVVRLTDFGGKPNSGEDTVVAMQLALEAIAAIEGPVVLACDVGCYDFYPEHAAQLPSYITNSASEQENPNVTKTICVLFQGLRNVILEGNGSLFRFHGRCTMFVFENCENVEICNLQTDFARPTMSEMTVETMGPQRMEVSVHRDSWYAIEDGKLYWKGEGWSYQDGPAQLYNPNTNTTWRVPNPLTTAIYVEEMEPFQLRIHYPPHAVPETAIGYTYQMRDGIRDQAGVFIYKSRNITWQNVSLHYTHGLGVVGQYSENLTFEGLRLAPRQGSGRTAAAFADGLHFSGCRGLVRIMNSHVEGTHDDPINIHGTHLRIIDKRAVNQIVVRFMHGQSYGFDAFHPGDVIELVSAASLVAYDCQIVLAVERLDSRNLLLTLNKSASESMVIGDVVENVTWTPQVEIRNNSFARVPTRGILVTTRRKVVIEHNTFDQTMMSAILIADDAESWFESGPVKDVTIRSNTFNHCGGDGHPVILIAPENASVDPDRPVHRNIKMEENTIRMDKGLVLSAKSTRGLSFRSNQICFSDANCKPDDVNDVIQLMACSDVNIHSNTIMPRKTPKEA